MPLFVTLQKAKGQEAVTQSISQTSKLDYVFLMGTIMQNEIEILS